MYIPEHFRVQDHSTAIAFMRANPFAILISTTDEGPYATHLPVVIRETANGVVIRGHVAKANPHWRHLEQSPGSLIIFHGPHAYVSPTNYATRENVPTWNYGSVHAYGKARIFSSPDELQELLHELIPLFESSYLEQWQSLSHSYRERMLGHIVGFEVAVSRIEAKFKLSQNRTRGEQDKVMSSLATSRDSTISGTAELMREQGLGIKADRSQS